jgi:hypothetical protein
VGRGCASTASRASWEWVTRSCWAVVARRRRTSTGSVTEMRRRLAGPVAASKTLLSNQDGPAQVGIGCDMKEGSPSGAPWILEFGEGLNGVDFYTYSVIHGPCLEGERERTSAVRTTATQRDRCMMMLRISSVG